MAESGNNSVLNAQVDLCRHPLIFHVHINGSTSSSHRLKCPEGIHAKLLYAFTRRLDETKKILRSKYGIELEVNGREFKLIYLTDLSAAARFSEESLWRLLTENILDDLEILNIPMDSNILREVLNKPEKDLPSALLVNRAAFFKCESLYLYHLVSEMGSYEKVKKELGLQIEEDKPEILPRMQHQSETRTVRVDTLDCRTLEYLDFDGHIQQKHPDVEVKISGSSCHLQLKKGAQIGLEFLSQTEFEEEIEQFLRNVSKEEIYFENEICYKLLYEANTNEPNVSLYTFLKRRKRIEKIHIFEKNEKHYVYSKEKNQAKEAKEAIEKNIHFHKLSKSSPDIQSFLKSESDHHKLIYEAQLDSLIHVACTSDLTSNLHRLLEESFKDEYEDINMQRYEIEFLKRFGASEIENCKKDHAVQIDFVEDTVVRLGGSKENFPACRQHLERFIESCTDEVALDISKESLESSCSEMDNIVMENNCSYHIEHDGGEGICADSSIVGSWIAPLEKLQVNIVTRCSTSFFVDLRVILTNHSLYPIGAVSLSPDVWDDYISRIGQKFRKDQENRTNVGDTFTFEKPVGLRCKKAVALVVSVNFQNNPVPISIPVLHQKLIETLQILDTESYRSVGIDVSGIGSDLVSVVQTTASVALKHVKKQCKKKAVEVFICGSKRDTEVICHTVNDIFKSEGGCSRKMMTAAAGLDRTDANIKVVVEKGSLPQIDAEVLVNTTNRELNLKEGQVSKIILELAGSDIQTYLSRKYPSGISFGDVAVTGSYNIRANGKNVQYIFHSALTKYDIQKFSKQIKVFVKKCLFQAEQLKCTSIAFPALGVGNLEYPRRETAAEIFDAVDEFCEEAIEPCLKKVTIVVYSKDLETCEAFKSAEWRRSKQYGRDVGEKRPEPTEEFRALWKQKDLGDLSSLQVTTKEDFKAPKSYAVVLNFSTREVSSRTIFKRAMEVPKSWNDKMTIFVPKKATEWQFKSNLEKNLKVLDEDRATEVVIYTTEDNNIHMAEGSQVVMICKILTLNKWEFIRNVLIVVTDGSAFQNVQTHINIDAHSWKLSSTKQTKKCVRVNLLGLDGESRGQAKEELLHLVHSIQEKERTAMVASNYERNRTEDIKGQTGNKDEEVVPSVDMEDVQAYAMMKAGDVSAEINPGIIEFKQCRKDLEPWMMQMEVQFELQIIVEKSGATKAIGGFDSILKFEQYLENELFVNLETIQFDEEHYSLKEEEYTDNVKIYQLQHLVVKVYKSDIKNVHVDCIAISSNAKLRSIKGVGKDVGDAAGDVAKEDREKILKKGGLKAKECCIGCPGDLKHTKAVAYVNLPVFLQNRNQLKVLSDFREALLNCFTTVDGREYKTLALPCIGSDANPKHFPFGLCVSEYVRALKTFKPTNIREIHFVDINEKNLEILTTSLDSLAQSASKEHNKSGPNLFYSLRNNKMFLGSQNENESVGVQIPGTQIKLFVTNQAIGAIKTDGIVCIVNEEFTSDSGVLDELQKYTSPKILSWFKEEQQKQHSPGQVLSKSNTGDANTFKYILYAVNSVDENKGQRTAFTLLENIFKNVPDVLRTIAIPVLPEGSEHGQSARRQQFHGSYGGQQSSYNQQEGVLFRFSSSLSAGNFVQTNCSRSTGGRDSGHGDAEVENGEAGPGQIAFVELLIKRCREAKTNLEEIHIVCKYEREVTAIYGYIKDVCKTYSRSPKPGFALKLSNV